MLKFIGGAIVLGVGVAGAFWAADLWPVPTPPLIDDPAALKPAVGKSVIVAPVSISYAALRSAAERVAPRTLSGEGGNVLGNLLANAHLDLSATRGEIKVAGRSGALALSAPFTGNIRVTGLVAASLTNLSDARGAKLSPQVSKQLQTMAGRMLDQSADIRGTVTLNAQPALTPAWQLEPNLSSDVVLAETNLTIGGLRINVPGEVRPLMEQAVKERVAALQDSVRSSGALEQVVRTEWTRLCRSLPIRTPDPLPDVWLEVRPLRAMAGPVLAGADDMTLHLGVEAETRITPVATTPDCPFPKQLDIAPDLTKGSVDIAVPIDLPFAEINRLVAAAVVGKTYPQGERASVEVTIKTLTLQPSGDRILMSLQVSARETKFVGMRTDARVEVWGRPVLDGERQMLRFADIKIDVESESAFGMLGFAARAAIPSIERAIRDHAVVDFKPYLASARDAVTASLSDLRTDIPGVQVDAAVSEIHVADIAFDSRTLRVVGHVDGALKASVTGLPMQ